MSKDDIAVIAEKATCDLPLQHADREDIRQGVAIHLLEKWEHITAAKQPQSYAARVAYKQARYLYKKLCGATNPRTLKFDLTESGFIHTENPDVPIGRALRVWK